MIVQPTLTKTQKYCLIFTLTLALTLVWTTLAHADGPGDLDITFGGTGVVTTSISSGYDGAETVAIQPDNKIVVAGTSNYKDFAVVRYNSDGSLDTSFKGTGIVTTPLSNAGSSGLDTVIQPNGKIVVAGYVDDGFSGNDFAIARYESNGDPDTSFGFLGAMVTPIGSGSDTGWGVALQSDGKIVVVGDTDVMGGLARDIAVVRYTITGTLDTEFNNTGVVTTRIASGFNNGIDVAIQPDNKIVVVGGIDVSGSNTDLAVVRYTITGTLDTSFNGTGIVTTPIGAGETLGLGVALQSDEKIVVTGGSNNSFFVARYNSDGSLDTSFNGFGYAVTPITSDFDFGNDLAIQPNGKIVVAGTSGWISGNDGNITVVRYNSDGSLDDTFGIVTTFINPASSGNGIAIQPDGKIVVAGQSGSFSTKFDFTVVRYLGDPTLTLTKTVDDQTPDPGQVITYTLVVSNGGIVTVTNALISDTLPANLSLAGPVELDPPGTGTIRTLPTLVSGLTITPGERITVTFPVTVNTASKIITNTATVTSNEVVLPQAGSVSITVAADTQPPTFPSTALITPTQGITVTTSRPTFDWEDATDVVGVVSYTLLLTGSAPFGGLGTLDTMDSVTTTESIFTPIQNLPNAAYTWTVQAHDSAGNIGTVMPPANFSIEVTANNNVYLPVVLKN